MMKNKTKDPLAQAARLLNENAPEGESLAYINQDEAKMLKDAGGAGEPVNSSGVLYLPPILPRGQPSLILLVLCLLLP